ncbi:hypothetical protein BP00DRAFT_450456 [Aspergillus indologenus CBS 114.80]|uniref:Uncharacterized protein n=1 Tax=Aspergillus indologenus CBS 114.80 TaxID=1450541 RepID=A0A2V5I037_9EURO|nr:hypothetical protein BP00DRAFT_450456 [Aspergillus indologenus CBS 114.80]
MADTQGLPGGWTSIVPSYSYSPEDDPRTLTMAASFQPARPATNSLLGKSAPPQHSDPTARPSELTSTPTYLNTSMQWTMAPLGTEFTPGVVPYLVDPWRPQTHSAQHTLASGPSGQNIIAISAPGKARQRVHDQISLLPPTGASGSGSSTLKEAIPEPPTSRIPISSDGRPYSTNWRRPRNSSTSSSVTGICTFGTPTLHLDRMYWIVCLFPECGRLFNRHDDFLKHRLRVPRYCKTRPN